MMALGDKAHHRHVDAVLGEHLRRQVGIGDVAQDLMPAPHPDHDSAERAHLRGLAGELGLLTTGSSDFHGTNKPIRLGAETTSEAAYEELLARATGAAVVTA